MMRATVRGDCRAFVPTILQTPSSCHGRRPSSSAAHRATSQTISTHCGILSSSGSDKSRMHGGDDETRRAGWRDWKAALSRGRVPSDTAWPDESLRRDWIAFIHSSGMVRLMQRYPSLITTLLLNLLSLQRPTADPPSQDAPQSERRVENEPMPGPAPSSSNSDAAAGRSVHAASTEAAEEERASSGRGSEEARARAGGSAGLAQTTTETAASDGSIEQWNRDSDDGGGDERGSELDNYASTDVEAAHVANHAETCAMCSCDWCLSDSHELMENRMR